MQPRADVLLLAAGFGTRLRPLTDTLPKALVQVGGRTLLEWNLELLIKAGFSRVIINLHYLKDQIKDFLGDGSRFGIEVLYSEENPILDTGGAIKNIESLLQHDNLLTLNCDIMAGRDLPLMKLLHEHQTHPSQPLMTMMLRSDPQAKSFGTVGVDGHGRVVQFLGVEYFGQKPEEELMFLGAQVLRRSLLAQMPAAGSIFSVTKNTLVNVLGRGGYVHSVQYDGAWSDAGTPERLQAVSNKIEKFL